MRLTKFDSFVTSLGVLQSHNVTGRGRVHSVGRDVRLRLP